MSCFGFFVLLDQLKRKSQLIPFLVSAAVIALADRQHMPTLQWSAGTELLAYEELLAEADDDVAWPELDENTACGLCYTSGPNYGPLWPSRGG